MVKRKIAYQVNATIKENKHNYRTSFTGFITKRNAIKYVNQFKAEKTRGLFWKKRFNKKPLKVEGLLTNIRIKKVNY